MYMYMYMYMYKHMYMYMYICIYAYLHICIYAYMHDEYMYGYGYVYIYMSVCVALCLAWHVPTANSKLIVPTVLSTAVLLFISAVHPHVCCRSDSCACATVATSVLALCYHNT